MFLNAQSRRLGDYAAGALVVKERRDVTLESVRQQTQSTSTSALDSPGATGLSESDYRLIVNFMARRNELRNREALALRIAVAVAARLGLPAPSSAREAEALLAQLARQPHR